MLETDVFEDVLDTPELWSAIFSQYSSQELWEARAKINKQHWYYSMLLLLAREDESSINYQKILLYSLANNKALSKNLDVHGRYELSKAVFNAIFSKNLPFLDKLQGLIAIQTINNKEITQKLPSTLDARQFDAYQVIDKESSIEEKGAGISAADFDDMKNKLKSAAEKNTCVDWDYLNSMAKEITVEQITIIFPYIIGLLNSESDDACYYLTDFASRLTIKTLTKFQLDFIQQIEMEDTSKLIKSLEFLTNPSLKLTLEQFDKFFPTLITFCKNNRNTFHDSCFTAMTSIGQMASRLSEEQFEEFFPYIVKSLNGLKVLDSGLAVDWIALALKSLRELAPRLSSEQIDLVLPFITGPVLEIGGDPDYPGYLIYVCLKTLIPRLNQRQFDSLRLTIIEKLNCTSIYEQFGVWKCFRAMIQRLDNEETNALLPNIIEILNFTMSQFDTWHGREFKYQIKKINGYIWDVLTELAPRLEQKQIESLLHPILKWLLENPDMVIEGFFKCLKRVIFRLDSELCEKFLEEAITRTDVILKPRFLEIVAPKLNMKQVDTCFSLFINRLRLENTPKPEILQVFKALPMSDNIKKGLYEQQLPFNLITVNCLGVGISELNSKNLNNLRSFCNKQDKQTPLSHYFYDYLAEAAATLQTLLPPSHKELLQKIRLYSGYQTMLEELQFFISGSVPGKANNNNVFFKRARDNIIIKMSHKDSLKSLSSNDFGRLLLHCQTLSEALKAPLDYLKYYQREKTSWSPQKATYPYVTEMTDVSRLCILCQHPQADLLFRQELEQEELIPNLLKKATLLLQKTDALYHEVSYVRSFYNLETTHDALERFMRDTYLDLKDYANFVLSYDDFRKALVQHIEQIPDIFLLEQPKIGSINNSLSLFNPHEEQFLAIIELAKMLEMTFPDSEEKRLGIMSLSL